MNSNVDFVLLIDDDRATNFFNLMMVGRHDAYQEVTAMQSGVEALEYLQSVEENNKPIPSLIFLDINMPGMNGWDFLREYEKLPLSITKKIKIIILSTTSNPAEIEKSIKEFDVDDFISKPLSLKLLDDVHTKHFLPVSL